jgi:hypothetical protein
MPDAHTLEIGVPENRRETTGLVYFGAVCVAEGDDHDEIRADRACTTSGYQNCSQ